MPVVEFENDPLGAVQKGGRRAHAAGQGHLPAGLDVANFHHRPVEIAKESVAHSLRQLREMHVEELRFSRVDAFAQFGIALVGRAELDGLARREDAVEGRSGAGPRDHTDGKRPARFVLGDGARGQLPRHGLGRTGRGETAEPDDIVMVDQGRGFGSREDGKTGDHLWRVKYYRPLTIRASSACPAPRNPAGKSSRLR